MVLSVDVRILREKDGLFGSRDIEVTSQDLDDFRRWLHDHDVPFESVEQTSRTILVVRWRGREPVTLHQLQQVLQGVELHVAPVERSEEDNVEVVER